MRSHLCNDFAQLHEVWKLLCKNGLGADVLTGCLRQKKWASKKLFTVKIWVRQIVLIKRNILTVFFYKFQHTSIWAGQFVQAKKSILKFLLVFINYNLSKANCTIKTTYFEKLERNGARERVACCCVLLACRGWSWGRFLFFVFVHILIYTNNSFPSHQTTVQLELSNFTKWPL